MSRVTIKDVSREAGVSTATVSRVLNQSGYVSEEIIERVYAAVEKLNYYPNHVARSLKQDKTNTVGIIVPDITNTYFMKISKGIEDVIQPEGYNLIFCSGDENPEKETELLQLLFEKRVDSIVLATSGKNTKQVKKIVQAGVPIILIDRKIEDDDLILDLLAEDNVKGGYGLTKYLLEQGHTRIGVVNGSLKVSTGFDRYVGFKKALNVYGLKEDPRLIFNGSFTEEDGRKAVDYFLSLPENQKPSAMISFNNSMTFGLLIELAKRNYRIPDDIVVASYGEVEAAQLLKPPGIITMKQSPYTIGTKTGQILLKRLLTDSDEEPMCELLDPVLVT